MKTAIYIEDGIVQLVLTPESEFEKNAIRSFESHPLSVKVFPGSFYDCRGGWTRQESYYGHGESSDRSVILRIEHRKTEAP